MSFLRTLCLLVPSLVSFLGGIQAVVQQSGIADQTMELPIDSSTCTIVSLPFPYLQRYACAEHHFTISTNISIIPSLMIHWYYRSTVVSSNGTDCSLLQVQCFSLCGSSSTYRSFNDDIYILPSCSCTNTVPYTQNISLRILSPFTNTSGNALPYPSECGSLPTGTSRIIYSVTDPVNTNNNNDNDPPTTPTTGAKYTNDAEHVYGAPIEVVVVISLLSVIFVFGVIRALIRYQPDPEENDTNSTNKGKDLDEPLPEIVVTDEHVDEILGAPPINRIKTTTEESKFDPRFNPSGIGMIEPFFSLSSTPPPPMIPPSIDNLESPSIVRTRRTLLPPVPLERSTSNSSFSSVPSTTSGRNSSPEKINNDYTDNLSNVRRYSPVVINPTPKNMASRKNKKSSASSSSRKIKPPHIPDRGDDENSSVSSPLESRTSSSDSPLPTVSKI